MAAKRIFRYLKGTTNFGVLYKAEAKENLFGCSDSDYAGDFEDRRSTSGFDFYDEFWCCILVLKEATNCDFVIYRS